MCPGRGAYVGRAVCSATHRFLHRPPLPAPGHFIGDLRPFPAARASKRPMTRISEIAICRTRSWPPPAPATSRPLEAVYARDRGTGLHAAAPARAPTRYRRGTAAGDLRRRARAHRRLRGPLPAAGLDPRASRSIARSCICARPGIAGLEWLDKDPGGADRLPGTGRRSLGAARCRVSSAR